VENSRTPLSPGQRDILEYLESHGPEHEMGFSWETAFDCLAEHDIEEAAARDQLEALLLKGYLYEVNGQLRIPPRPYE
jgi:hypothetical protein